MGDMADDLLDIILDREFEQVSFRTFPRPRKTRAPKVGRERYIVMPGEEVAAILAGQQTQVVRLAKGDFPLTCAWTPAKKEWHGKRFFKYTDSSRNGDVEITSPFGLPGDRLWARETWAYVGLEHDWETGYVDGYYDLDLPKVVKTPTGAHHVVRLNDASVWYQWELRGSDMTMDGITPEERGFTWRSPIQMPRWASRLTMEVTSVRVGNLQKLAGVDDAIALGMVQEESNQLFPLHGRPEWDWACKRISPVDALAWEWNNRNPKDPWETDPVVWSATIEAVPVKKPQPTFEEMFT